MKRKYRKKETIITKLFNAVITLGLAGIMVYGLQCYSSSDLKFVQLSDVHFSDAGVNTTFKMTGESPKLLEDAVNQINEIPDVNFVMFTGDQVNVPYEKELQAFLKYAEKIKAPWYITFGNHDRCVGGYLTKELSEFRRFCSDTESSFQVVSISCLFAPRTSLNCAITSDFPDLLE